MTFFIKLFSIIAGAVFPAFLIKAIKAQDDDGASKYTILACASFGIIVFTLMGFL